MHYAIVVRDFLSVWETIFSVKEDTRLIICSVNCSVCIINQIAMYTKYSQIKFDAYIECFKHRHFQCVFVLYFCLF